MVQPKETTTMTTLQTAGAGLRDSASIPRLPVPPPKQAKENQSPKKPAPKIPYAGKEPAPAPLTPLAAGTMIDGIDCGGMTDDPKKAPLPVYLQTQNRKELSPEQKAKVDELQAKLKAAEKAKVRERKETAKKLGMSPTEMSKPGAKLKSETAKKKAPKKGTPKKASKARKAGTELRPGSKSALIADMLRRKNGCTTAEVLKATGWPAVSMPQQARVAGIKLVKEKDGKVTRYRAA